MIAAHYWLQANARSFHISERKSKSNIQSDIVNVSLSRILLAMIPSYERDIPDIQPILVDCYLLRSQNTIRCIPFSVIFKINEGILKPLRRERSQIHRYHN